MSKKAIVVTILLIVLIVVGGWALMKNSSTSSQATTSGTIPNTQGARTTPNSGNVAISNSSNSDAALNQDMSSVDTQMNGLNSDNASADQGISNPNQ